MEKYKFSWKDLSLNDFKTYFFSLFKAFIPKKKIKSFDELEEFIQEKSAWVSQVTLYGYLKTRIGTRYVLHFDNEEFMKSVNLAKWNIYAVSLQDLTFFTFSYLKVHFNLEEVNSIACFGMSNGAIQAVASGGTGNLVYALDNMTNTTGLFENLEAGTYEMCITVENQEDYELCYTVIITEPSELSVFSRTDKKRNKLDLNLSGGDSYFIEFNGSIITTKESKVSLPLGKGINQIKVSTSKNCQGTFKETINNSSNILVYPNPVNNENKIEIITGDVSIKRVELLLTSTLGKVLTSKSVTLKYGKTTLDVSKLNSGIYMLTVISKEGQSNFKILKK